MEEVPKLSPETTEDSQHNSAEVVTIERLGQKEYAKVYIDCLPSELLDYIFTFLNIKERIQTERVCQRWRSLGTGQWTEPKHFIYDDWRKRKSSLREEWRLTDNILGAILSRVGSVLRYLKIAKFHSEVFITPNVFKSISHNCLNLMEIDLNIAALTSTALQIIGESCKKLKVVSLKYDGDEDLQFESFFKNCQALESLTLACKKVCPKPNDFDVINKSLKVLRLSCYSCLQPEALDKLMERCDHIQKLCLGDLDKYELLTPEDLLKVILHYADTLKVLDLTGSIHVINWCAFISEFQNIEELYMDSHEKLSFECCCFENVCAGSLSNKLKIFSVFAGESIFDEAFVENLLKRNDHLQELHLLYGSHVSLHSNILKLCYKYTDSMRVLEFIDFEISCKADEWCQLFAALRNLESLTLNSCGRGANDSVTRALSIHGHKLRSLDISNTFVTDDGVIDLCALPCLTELDLSDLVELTDAGIACLAIQGRLEKLNVSKYRTNVKTPKITDASCRLLARHCRKFRQLVAVHLADITDILVDAFYESIKAGILKDFVTLYVVDTSVTGYCKKHSRLDVVNWSNLR